MKLIKLKMKAFLTYKDEVCVDFEEINKSGLYLISGPTGSGKTSLYDAITFALFGKASGSSRDQSHFRSGFALDSDDTYVELEFMHHDVIYNVKRSPKYQKTNRKTELPAKAILTYNNQCIEGPKEVTKQIETILGIDVNQFKQIVMIAQGEFTKLIYATSEEREKVLRHIFHSESLVKFEMILKDKTRELHEEYKRLNQTLTARFSSLSFDEQFMSAHQLFHESYIQDAIDENKTIYDNIQTYNIQYEQLDSKYIQDHQRYLLDKELNERIKEYVLLQDEYKECLKESDYYNQVKSDLKYISLVESKNEQFNELQRLKKELSDLNKEIIEYNESYHNDMLLKESYLKEYNSIPLLNKEKEQLLLKQNNLNKEKEKKEHYLSLIQTKTKLLNDFEELSLEYEENRKGVLSYEANINRDKETVSKISTLEVIIQNLEVNAELKNKRRTQLHELSDQHNNYHLLNEDHLEHMNRYLSFHDNYLMKENKYKEENEKFKRYQAGILASSLKQGDPCPVCGSTHHPCYASLQDDILNSQELDELSRQLDILKQQDNELYQEVVDKNNLKKKAEYKIESLKNELDICEDITKQLIVSLLYGIENEIKESKKEYNQYKDELKYLKTLKSGLSKREEKLTNMTIKLSMYENKLNEIKENIVSHDALLNEFDCEAVHIDYDSLLKECCEKINELDCSIRLIDNNYNQLSREIVKKEEIINRLKLSVEKMSNQIHERDKEINDYIVLNFKDYEQFMHYRNKLSDKEKHTKQYNDYHLRRSHLELNLSRINDEIKNKQIKDLKEDEVNLNLIKEQLTSLLSMKSKLENQYETNSHILDEIQKDYLKNKDVLKEYTLYKDLYDIASGKSGSRISFERYVLSYYFERILDFANIELTKMTNGRYYLLRKTQTKGNSRQGLDLSVLDYETAMVRDVQSLSGGESFKAALSLALGLSSMIQNYAGGIELNTLFIDEGFGSLDNESLNVALNVLMNLQNSNKVIGIISHVEELKERIQTQIQIEKKEKGSTLKIIHQ